MLGTFVELKVQAESDAIAAKAVADAFAAIAKVQELMSYHDPFSELTRLNCKAERAPVQVNRWTFTVLKTALTLSAQSEGAFDVTIAPRLASWGYLPRAARVLGGERLATWRDIELIGVCLVRYRRPLHIDLGGIAKGFAVDRAIDAARAAGATAALVNAGGDLRAFGSEPWPVAIRHPAQPGETAHSFALENSALATSAAYFSRKKWRGCAVCPLVDGVTRLPCDDRLSVSVQAPEAMVADALCKIVTARREASAPILSSYHASALILDERGQCTMVATEAEATVPL